MKKNGKLKIIGINSKKMRGLMTNHVILNKLTKLDDLKNFSAMNYVLDEKLSSADDLVFVR